jgi:hypothetical protein
MAIDLTPRWKDFAVYLPAIQGWYSTAVYSDKSRDKSRAFPKGITLKDLDYLNPKSKLWHYGYGLYSAGLFSDDRPRPCSVANRDKSRTTILGDSGGYQIGIGTFPGTKHIKKEKTADGVVRAWTECSAVRERVVNWLEANSDYAMTIDMPLWLKTSTQSTSPFKICSDRQLLDMTVENLKFIQRKRLGRTKWLNVIQGTNASDSKMWWDEVKKFRFDGWALAGTVGWGGGLYSVLSNVLMMRDEGAFEDGQDWLHVLGVSRPTWGVIFTAIQRELRKLNPKLQVSYDSASPFQMVGKYQQTNRYPKFSSDMKSWAFSAIDIPTSSLYANTSEKYHFPFASPIGELLTLDHINVNVGSYQGKPADSISWLLMINHTLYIYVRAFLEANELAFMNRNDAQNHVPQKILKALDFIEHVFKVDDWKKELKDNEDMLQEVFGRASTKEDSSEPVNNYEAPLKV